MQTTNWMLWRKCRICGAETGEACRARSSYVANGQTQGGIYVLPTPHTSRAMRRFRRGQLTS